MLYCMVFKLFFSFLSIRGFQHEFVPYNVSYRTLQEFAPERIWNTLPFIASRSFLKHHECPPPREMVQGSVRPLGEPGGLPERSVVGIATLHPLVGAIELGLSDHKLGVPFGPSNHERCEASGGPAPRDLVGAQGALVENMVKKNRNRFPIAVLWTTLICSH